MIIDISWLGTSWWTIAVWYHDGSRQLEAILIKGESNNYYFEVMWPTFLYFFQDLLEILGPFRGFAQLVLSNFSFFFYKNNLIICLHTRSSEGRATLYPWRMRDWLGEMTSSCVDNWVQDFLSLLSVQFFLLMVHMLFNLTAFFWGELLWRELFRSSICHLHSILLIGNNMRLRYTQFKLTTTKVAENFFFDSSNAKLFLGFLLFEHQTFMKIRWTYDRKRVCRGGTLRAEPSFLAGGYWRPTEIFCRS